MYEVIHFFTDLQDFGHAYKVGDSFPRPGVAASEARLKELSGSNNRQKTPLIRLVGGKEADASATEPQTEETAKAYTKTDINRLPKDELVRLATENGVEDAAELNGADLKRILIEKMGL